MPYRVLVDDNFHAYDENERCEAGVFDTEEEAMEAARSMVVRSLCEGCGRAKSPAELYDYYLDFGDDPFVSPRGSADFSAWTYAKEIAPVVFLTWQIATRRRDGTPQAPGKRRQ
jgi:hypothetical protein